MPKLITRRIKLNCLGTAPLLNEGIWRGKEPLLLLLFHVTPTCSRKWYSPNILYHFSANQTLRLSTSLHLAEKCFPFGVFLFPHNGQR